MLRRGVEVLDLERERGQLAVAGGVARVLLDQAQVLAEGAADVAPLAQELGEAQPGGRVVAVQAEDVAELDHRALRVVRLEQRQRAPVVLLGALLGAVAGGDRQDGEEQDRAERPRKARIWELQVPERRRAGPAAAADHRRAGAG